MTVILHVLTTLWCAMECVLALRDPKGRIARLVIFSGLGMIHGFVPAITPSDLMLAEFSESSRAHAAGLAFVGVVLLSCGWKLSDAFRSHLTGLSPGLETVLEAVETQKLLSRMFWICGIVGVLAWVYSVVVTGISVTEVFETARFAERRSIPIYSAAIAQYFLALTSVPGFVCFFLPRRYRLLGVGYAIGMAILLFLASRGSRANSIGLLGSVVMGYALRHRMVAYRVALVGIAGVLLLVLTVALYDVRKTMMQQTASGMVESLFTMDTYRGALARDPLSYHQFLVAAVELFPDHHPFLNGATYRRMFVFFLPRQYFWFIKPEDPNMTFAEVVNPRSSQAFTTVPPTMMGDGYINFWGWPGILIMFVNGFVLGFVERKIRTSLLWFIAVGAPFFRLSLLAMRGQPYEILLVGVSGVVIIWILGRCVGYSFRDSRLFARQVEVGGAYRLAM